jgi:virulence-associated protein VapD
MGLVVFQIDDDTFFPAVIEDIIDALSFEKERYGSVHLATRFLNAYHLTSAVSEISRTERACQCVSEIQYTNAAEYFFHTVSSLLTFFCIARPSIGP